MFSIQTPDHSDLSDTQFGQYIYHSAIWHMRINHTTATVHIIPFYKLVGYQVGRMTNAYPDLTSLRLKLEGGPFCLSPHSYPITKL